MIREESLRKDLERLRKQFRITGSLADQEYEIERVHTNSKKLKWGEGISQCLYFQSRVAEEKREMEQAEQLNSESEKLAENLDLENLILDCRASEANLFFWNNKLKEAYHLALNTLASAEILGNYHAAVLCNYVLGSVSQRYASDDLALQYFQSGLETAHKHGFQKLNARILDKLSELFLARLKYGDDERYALQSATLQNKLGILPTILRSKMRLISIYIESNKVDNIKPLIDEITLNEKHLLSAEKGSFALCKGKIAQQLKKYEEAQKFYNDAINIFTKSGRSVLIANAYLINCEMYLARKNPKEALSNAKRALQFIGTGFDDYLETQTYRLMYEASKISEDTRNALKYLELYNERFLKQEEQLLQSRIQFIELQAEYQMNKTEIMDERRRAKKLHIELEYKERELTEKTRHLIKQTDVITQFRDDLRAIIHRSPANDPFIRQIQNRLEQVSESTLTWEDFNKEFEAAHPEFTTKLGRKHPLLSSMEKKVCTMMRVGLTSGDIAKLLSLSERNIENHRYRIRKKISLNTERSLHEYLATI